MLRRGVFMALLALVAVVGATSTAWADDGFSAVQCQQSNAPGCKVTVGSATVAPASASSLHVQAGVTNGGICKDFFGRSAPCTNPVWGWMGSDGCYWKVDTGYSPPIWNTADQHAGQRGAWFLVSCTTGNFPGTGGGVVWVPTGAKPVPLPPPAVLARQAVNRLRLSGPQIATSPPSDRMQLVNVPTWLWLSRSSWSPVSATASVPGESVTATAVPRSVIWLLGDGSRVVCDGPGTPYVAGDDPTAPSPDCGHTYLRSSAGEPGGAFVVSATVSWGVSWSAVGRSGSLPALATTSASQLRVGESQAVNTNGSGA